MLLNLSKGIYLILFPLNAPKAKLVSENDVFATTNGKYNTNL